MLLRWARLYQKAAWKGEAGVPWEWPWLGVGSELGGAPTQTMTVAIMDSSASLKLSMRWECWVPSAASSSLVLMGESPGTLRAGPGVRGSDMTGACEEAQV